MRVYTTTLKEASLKARPMRNYDLYPTAREAAIAHNAYCAKIKCCGCPLGKYYNCALGWLYLEVKDTEGKANEAKAKVGLDQIMEEFP